MKRGLHMTVMLQACKVTEKGWSRRTEVPGETGGQRSLGGLMREEERGGEKKKTKTVVFDHIERSFIVLAEW